MCASLNRVLFFFIFVSLEHTLWMELYIRISKWFPLYDRQTVAVDCQIDADDDDDHRQ